MSDVTNPNPLAGTVFQAPSESKACPGCSRFGRALAAVLTGAWGCSNTECPMRRLAGGTARPSERPVPLIPD